MKDEEGGFIVGGMSSDVCKSGVNLRIYLRIARSSFICPFYSTTAFAGEDVDDVCIESKTCELGFVFWLQATAKKKPSASISKS